MQIDPEKPIADGVSFDDTLGMTEAQVRLLIQRETLFSTAFVHPGTGRKFCGTVIADSEEKALAAVAKRGLGETIVGRTWSLTQQ